MPVSQTVVIIGWGSLLWDLDNLEHHVSDKWACDAGPCLPLEFVRVSPKRLQALTVVIDHDHGVPCRTSYIRSRRNDPLEAVGDLAARERADPLNIGYVDVRSASRRSRHGDVPDIVAAWLEVKGYRAAVWTDLSGNFAETTGKPYSLEGAVEYLAALEGRSRVEAKRYIDSAPGAINTPLRCLLDSHPWWRRIEY